MFPLSTNSDFDQLIMRYARNCSFEYYNSQHYEMGKNCILVWTKYRLSNITKVGTYPTQHSANFSTLTCNICKAKTWWCLKNLRFLCLILKVFKILISNRHKQLQWNTPLDSVIFMNENCIMKMYRS